MSVKTVDSIRGIEGDDDVLIRFRGVKFPRLDVLRVFRGNVRDGWLCSVTSAPPRPTKYEVHAIESTPNVWQHWEEPEQFHGGLASGMSPEQFDPEQLELGIETEMAEHGFDPAAAQEVAMDHLVEDQHYYGRP